MQLLLWIIMLNISNQLRIHSIQSSKLQTKQDTKNNTQLKASNHQQLKEIHNKNVNVSNIPFKDKQNDQDPINQQKHSQVTYVYTDYVILVQSNNQPQTSNQTTENDDQTTETYGQTPKSNLGPMVYMPVTPDQESKSNFTPMFPMSGTSYYQEQKSNLRPGSQEPFILQTNADQTQNSNQQQLTKVPVRVTANNYQQPAKVSLNNTVAPKNNSKPVSSSGSIRKTNYKNTINSHEKPSPLLSFWQKFENGMSDFLSYWLAQVLGSIVLTCCARCCRCCCFKKRQDQ